MFSIYKKFILPIFGAAWVALTPWARAVVLEQDFDSGSLRVESVTIQQAESDSPVITLAPRAVMATGRWYHFDVKGVQGKRPVFRIPLQNDADRAHPDYHRYVYRYRDATDYLFFKNGERTEQHFIFSTDAPFTEDTVRIATALPYPVARTLAHTASIMAAPWVSATPSADASLIVGYSPGTELGGYTDDLGRTVPRLPLIGYCITDPAIPNDDKVHVVLTSGTHASEVTANHVLEGKVDFLISDDPDAVELRRRAVIFVYPQVNPEGRWAGYMRSAPETPRINFNRDWKEQPENRQVALMIEAILRDTGGQAAVVVDYHSIRRGRYEIWDEREYGEQQPYFQALKELRPQLRWLESTNPNNVRQWGRHTLGAVESFTFEVGAFIPGWSVPEYHALGADSARALLMAVRAATDAPGTAATPSTPAPK